MCENIKQLFLCDKSVEKIEDCHISQIHIFMMIQKSSKTNYG